MIITRKIALDTTKKELWAYLTEFEKIQKWNSTMLEEEELSDRPVNRGFKSRVLIKEGKRTVWYGSEIHEYQENKRLSLSLSGGNLGKSPMVLNYEIVDKGNQVELLYQSTWEPRGLFLKLMHPLIKSISNKNIDGSLSALKKEVEK